MKDLGSYVLGRWLSVGGSLRTLVNPATEEPLARAGSGSVDFGAVVDHARSVGGPALRTLTFAQRGEALLALSRLFHTHRDELLDLGVANGGATRSDAKFDVDGATGTLASYGELGAQLGDRRLLVDGEGIGLGRGAKLWGQHVWVPRHGVAVHINAFNFPAWGTFEKLAVAILAGVPVITKPATATALLAHRMMELLVESHLLPDAAVQMICGDVGDLFDHLGPQDHVAFTGSSATALTIRSHRRLIERSVRINIEADSLNCAILADDVQASTDVWDLFLQDVAKEITQKTGQKCTAVRRIYVPARLLTEVREALADRLSAVRVGNPTEKDVTMGPLATAQQLADVRAGVARLLGCAKAVHGDPQVVEPIGAPAGKGYFHPVLLLENPDPQPGDAAQTLEVFGPVATLMPYSGRIADLAPLVAAGSGGLVTSFYSDDEATVRQAIAELGPHHGRLVLGSAKVAGQTIPPGAVLPQLVHGGPGRAGGGEELGGMRGLAFYCQRTALQGARTVIERVTAG